MAAFFMRILAYLCLTLALALALGPYSDRMEFLEDSPRVLISAVALTEKGIESTCPDQVYDLTRKSLAAEPVVEKAVRDIGREPTQSNYVFVETAGAEKFIQGLTGEKRPEACFRFQGQTFKLITSQFTGYSDFFLVGISPDQIRELPVVPPELLKGLPGVSAYLKGLGGPKGGEPVYDQAETDITPKEWRALRDGLNLAGTQTAVRAGDFVLFGVVEDRRVRRTVELKGLRAGRMALAALLLVPGLWFWRGVYRRRPGFSAGTPWTSLTGDALLILVGTAGAYGLVEAVQWHWFAVQPWLRKSTIYQYVTFGYLPYLAVCAWLKIKSASWGLEVTGTGLVKHGPGGARTMVWDEIKGLGWKSGSAGVDHLVIRLKSGEDSLPVSHRAGDREALVSDLTRLAPSRLQEEVRGLSPA